MTTSTIALSPPDVFAAVEAAESRALADHEAGVCHLSEWSCSHCESAQ